MFTNVIIMTRRKFGLKTAQSMLQELLDNDDSAVSRNESSNDSDSGKYVTERYWK